MCVHTHCNTARPKLYKTIKNIKNLKKNTQNTKLLSDAKYINIQKEMHENSEQSTNSETTY